VHGRGRAYRSAAEASSPSACLACARLSSRCACLIFYTGRSNSFLSGLSPSKSAESRLHAWNGLSQHLHNRLTRCMDFLCTACCMDLWIL